MLEGYLLNSAAIHGIILTIDDKKEGYFERSQTNEKIRRGLCSVQR